MLLSIVSIGQITPDFTADSLAFCAPYLITFEDKSTGSNIIYRHWVFGPNNQSVGNNKNPSVSYVTPGTYDATLTISNGIDTVSVTKPDYITVWEDPSPGFFTNSTLTGCAPISVSFNDQSTPGDAPIQSRVWTFGDNSAPDSALNPTHQYTQSGPFTVSLYVEDTNGCNASIDKPALVSPKGGPTADFGSSSSPHNCIAPLTVNFTNLSTGTNPLSYHWDFGNGSTSTQINPTVTYNNSGAYNVSLTVTDTLGCSDTELKTNFASATTTSADFNLSNYIVCRGEPVEFNNASVGGSQAIWDFGDNSGPDNKWNPVHTYNNPGSYTVRLIVFSSSACRDTIEKQIAVQQLSANFSVATSNGCETPHTAELTSSNIGMNYTWKFGDGTSVSSSSRTITHEYNQTGSFSPWLVIESNSGCKDSIQVDSAVNIYEIKQNFTATDLKGCAPLTITFNDQSTPTDSIGSWYWDSGDSTNSTQKSFTHTYTDTGVYEVVSRVWTHDSVCDAKLSRTVEVGIPQNAAFTTDTNVACAADSTAFINLSSDVDHIDEYLWDFGDGSTSGKFEPKHVFSDTGWLDISLTVSHNGCDDSTLKQQYFRALGPVVNFAHTIPCDSPFTAFFNPNLVGVDSLYWDFGDFHPGDTAKNPVHTYAASSDYTATLTAYNFNTGCQFKRKKDVHIRDLKARFNVSDSTACAPATVQFNAGISQDETPYYYQWNFGNGIVNSSGPIKAVNLTQRGITQVQLIVTDINLCTDTAYGQIQSFKPEANFTVDTTMGCAPFKPSFKDLSISDTNIVNWNWSFGNYTTANTKNPVALYDPLTTRWFSVQLTVTDTFGCAGYTRKKEYVKAIRAPFRMLSDPDACVGEAVDYENLYHFTGNTYQWIFSNGDTLHGSSASVKFNQPGKYDVTVMVTGSEGCSDTISHSGQTQVHESPQPKFTAEPRDTSCYPAIVEFTDTSGQSNIQTRKWIFGDNTQPSTTGTTKAFHNYTKPGSYNVQLILTSNYGCTDTTELKDFILIGGPYGVLHFDDDSICAGGPVTFELDSTKNIHKTRWDFGDGHDSVVIGNVTRVKHDYAFGGRLVVRAFYEDSAQKCPKFSEDTVFIHEINAGFSIDTSSGCAPLNVGFEEATTGADGFNWNVDAKPYTGKTQFTHLFTEAGEKVASLIATDNATGCKDTISRLIDVYPVPEVITSSRNVVCSGDSAVIFASGGSGYQWNPLHSLKEVSPDTMLAFPETSTTYQVDVKNQFGCESVGTLRVVVSEPPDYTIAEDTSIYKGETIPIWVNSEDTISVNWDNHRSVYCPSCRETVVEPGETRTYKVRINDKYGCFAIDTNVTVKVSEGHTLYIPNAFTPNNDGLNDEFHFVADGFKELISLQIFNRWGELVYETTDLNATWDGSIEGEEMRSTQVFTYLVALRKYDGTLVEQKGIICLVK